MFVQNQISHLKNHKDIVIEEINKAEEMLFVVAYVRENGVDAILGEIKSKSAKLLCSLDMGITQLSGIEKLLKNGVDVRVYKSNEGTFHPKIWLFGKNKKWRMLIGSANLTHAALVDNVEASVLIANQDITTSALTFFNYLWDDQEKSSPISLDEIQSLQNTLQEREILRDKSAQITTPEVDLNDKRKVAALLEYISGWVDIPKYDSRGISGVWRGWYIIPDHGYVDDGKIKSLKPCLHYIGKDGIAIGNKTGSKEYEKLLSYFLESSEFQREKLKTTPHGLFVRQAKNYLIKFGWCCHPIKENGKPDKSVLCLTSLGQQIKQCSSVDCVKALYTEYFLNYSYNGLRIVRFTKLLLQRLEYLSLEEFDYFVTHAYGEDDLETIVNLVTTYRSLADASKANLKQQYRNHFEEVKERTAKNVYGNYIKNVKHTISVIAWCEGFSRDDDFMLKLTNGS